MCDSGGVPFGWLQRRGEQRFKRPRRPAAVPRPASTLRSLRCAGDGPACFSIPRPRAPSISCHHHTGDGTHPSSFFVAHSSRRSLRRSRPPSYDQRKQTPRKMRRARLQQQHLFHAPTSTSWTRLHGLRVQLLLSGQVYLFLFPYLPLLYSVCVCMRASVFFLLVTTGVQINWHVM